MFWTPDGSGISGWFMPLGYKMPGPATIGAAKDSQGRMTPYRERKPLFRMVAFGWSRSRPAINRHRCPLPEAKRRTRGHPAPDAIEPKPTFARVSGCKQQSCNFLALRMTILAHSALIPNCLIIGHHFSASAFTRAPSTSGVCCSRGKTS